MKRLELPKLKLINIIRDVWKMSVALTDGWLPHWLTNDFRTDKQMRLAQMCVCAELIRAYVRGSFIGECGNEKNRSRSINARERVLLNIVEQVCNALHDFYITSLLPILMVFSCLFQQNYFHKSSIAMVKKQPKLDLVPPLIFSLFRQVYFCLSCFESTGVLAKKYWGTDEGVLKCWRTGTLVVQKRN